MKRRFLSLSLSPAQTSCTLALAVILLWLNPATIAQVSPELARVRITVVNAEALADELLASGFDVLEATISQNSFDAIVGATDVTQLRALGIQSALIAKGRPFSKIQEERREQQGGGLIQDVPDGYFTLAEINAEMQSIADKFPAICKLVDLTKTYNAPPTVEGRHIFAVKISDNVDLDEDEPATMIVSTHHAREIVNPVIVLNAIAQLTNEYGIDPAITAAVDENEIWIVPVWNVDGYEYVFTTDNWWRKNRRPLEDDIFGVDLNRNYPFLWDTPCSGSDNPASQVYKGPEPASESETRTMIAWSDAEHFCKVIDFHSSGREAIWAYSCSNYPLGDWLQSEAAALATAASYDGRERPAGAEGEHYQYQLGQTGAHAFLIETHEEFQPEYQSALDEAANVWPGILWMLEREIPIVGWVTDADSAAPIDAVAINVLNVNYENDESNESEDRFGRFEVFLPDGEYDLEFSAVGYATEIARGVEVISGTPVELAVELVQLGISLSVDTLIGGQDGTFTVSDSVPGVETYLAYSLRGLGETFIAALNVTLDLRAPKQAGAVEISGETGQAAWNLPIPLGAVGRTIWLQAAQFGNVTNVVKGVIE